MNSVTISTSVLKHLHIYETLPQRGVWKNIMFIHFLIVIMVGIMRQKLLSIRIAFPGQRITQNLSTSCLLLHDVVFLFLRFIFSYQLICSVATSFSYLFLFYFIFNSCWYFVNTQVLHEVVSLKQPLNFFSSFQLVCTRKLRS